MEFQWADFSGLRKWWYLGGDVLHSVAYRYTHVLYVWVCVVCAGVCMGCIGGYVAMLQAILRREIDKWNTGIIQQAKKMMK